MLKIKKKARKKAREIFIILLLLHRIVSKRERIPGIRTFYWNMFIDLVQTISYARLRSHKSAQLDMSLTETKSRDFRFQWFFYRHSRKTLATLLEKGDVVHIKITHKRAFLLSGGLWFLIGALLMVKSMTLFKQAALLSHLPMIRLSTFLLGEGEIALLGIAMLGLLVGYIKGKTVLSKSAMRAIERIHRYPSPFAIKHLYTLPYFFIILGMMGLGLLLRFCSIPVDIHAVIDLSVGSALIYGSSMYFKQAFKLS